jgi:hypothetical protein
VEVSVDDWVFRVGAYHFTPITCELPPGEHLLRMTRGGTLLYAESFILRSGEDRVLTAWHPPPVGGMLRSASAAPPQGGGLARVARSRGERGRVP